MRSKFVVMFFLCGVIVFMAVSCHTSPHTPVESTAELSNSVSDGTNAPEIQEQPIPESIHVTLVEGTLSTDQYTLVADESGCYIRFLDEYAASDEDKLACSVIEISFDSMADLVAGFQNNQLNEHQRIILQASFPMNEKGIEICDLNHLYDAVLPDGTCVSSVTLHGETYDCFVKGELFKSGSVSYVEDWTTSKDRMYDWSKGATVTREEDSTFDGVPCRIVEYYNSTQTYRDIFVETDHEGKKVDMVLRYLLEDKRPFPERVSDTAPWNVRMYCEDNGVFYDISLKELTETPSYEWLSSFGLTPYVPASEDVFPTE